MDETPVSSEKKEKSKLIKPFMATSNLNKILIAAIGISILLGVSTGYVLATKSPSNGNLADSIAKTPKNPEQDKKTFRDFAEGTIKKKPEPKNNQEYSEGTHLLEREGALPVTLTSSVVDLSQYENKKVKVFGETQKAIKAGWLMDVGRVEELN
ncbi:hypothetical protein HYW42_02570 [Candidatus Daviesbacteria bacterium]|nr:hypothetical protein [Candidatus Daviesbacteria bacterium]